MALKDLQVMVVEDHGFQRRIALRLLAELGVDKVLEGADGLHALDVLRQLKHDPRTCTIPVVMLTSSNLLRDVTAGYELGANSYVQKPVDFAEFRDTVRLLGLYWLTVNEPPPPVALGSAEDLSS